MRSGSRVSAWLSALTRNPLRWVTRPESGLQLAGQQTQQTGLAVAVAPDDAGARAIVDPERDRIEHHLRRVFEVNGLGSDQVRHWNDASKRKIWRRGLAWCNNCCPRTNQQRQRDTVFQRKGIPT